MWWASKGFRLPIRFTPVLRHLRNHRLDNLQAAFLNKEIAHLLKEKAIQPLLDNENALISPLGVVSKKNGKFWPIVDLWFLNEFLEVPKFKYKGLKELALIVREGDWTATIDFHDGFQHVEIDPAHQHLLSIEWRGRRYAFMDWREDNNWVAPPIAMIPRVIQLVQRQGATATIVALVWRGCHWWNDLLELTIDQPVEIRPNAATFAGDFGVLPEPLCNKKWRWMAFWICGKTTPAAGVTT